MDTAQKSRYTKEMDELDEEEATKHKRPPEEEKHHEQEEEEDNLEDAEVGDEEVNPPNKEDGPEDAREGCRETEGKMVTDFHDSV